VKRKRLLHRFYESPKHISQTVARGYRLTGHHLHKPDCGRLFAEALATQIKAILADETRLVSAKATVDPGAVSIVSSRP